MKTQYLSFPSTHLVDPGLCCTHDCGRVCTWSSLGLSLSDRCTCHATNFSRPCTYCARRPETPSPPDEKGIPVHQRFRRKGRSQTLSLPPTRKVLMSSSFVRACPPQRFRFGLHVHVQHLLDDVVHHADQSLSIVTESPVVVSPHHPTQRTFFVVLPSEG